MVVFDSRRCFLNCSPWSRVEKSLSFLGIVSNYEKFLPAVKILNDSPVKRGTWGIWFDHFWRTVLSLLYKAKHGIMGMNSWCPWLRLSSAISSSFFISKSAWFEWSLSKLDLRNCSLSFLADGKTFNEGITGIEYEFSEWGEGNEVLVALR